MRKVVLFIAMSLDGYVADKNGGVDWLYGHDKDSTDMGSYGEFIKSVDTVLLGYNTYHQVATVLSPNVWAYEGLKSYVITHRENLTPVANDIEFYSGSLSTLINKLKQQDGKDIFVCGGAKIANELCRENLIDVYDISVIPTILGGGTRLFEDDLPTLRLELKSSDINNGIQQLTYTVKNA